MCDTCGCSDNSNVTIRKPDESNHTHLHDHHHSHDHNHDHHSERRIVDIEQDALYQNNLLAERNRGFLEARNIKTYNLVSSPGSGKTTLLESTIKLLENKDKVYVIEGDQQTMSDANRIHKTGVKVIQVNTGNGCHLDAHMVNHAIKDLEISENSILFIENVGNLVCPALFNLGETKRIVIISVTEGEDKPLKYPNMFNSSHVCIINKIDLLPYVDFSVEKVKKYAHQVNHHLEFIETSAKTGEGLSDWIEWLRNQQ